MNGTKLSTDCVNASCVNALPSMDLFMILSDLLSVSNWHLKGHLYL